MEIDNSKFERQRLAAERWRISQGIGTWNHVPQFGKTYGAITFVINPHLEKLNSNDVIIVVTSEIIQKQWYDNLQSYGKQHHRIRLYTANNVISNDLHLECSLLIVDEIHKFTTTDKTSIIDGSRIISKYRLGLTGTYPYDNSTINKFYPIVDIITETEAIEHGWISNFIEYNLLLTLSDKDKIKYKIHTQPIQETLELFRGKSAFFAKEVINDDYRLIEACYRGVKAKNARGVDIYIKFDYICNFLGTKCGWTQDINLSTEQGLYLNNNWNPTNIHTRAKNFINAVQRRNEILIDNPVKLYAVGDIMKHSTKTTICFNESVNFADTIANYVNALFENTFPAVCYHSRLDSRPLIDPTTGKPYIYVSGKHKGDPKIFGKTLIKRYVIEYMNTGYFKFLSTAKALDEGTSIPRIEQVICTGGTTNPVTYDQRTARGKTINIYNPEKITTIFNLVFDDFKDPDTGDVIYSRDKAKLITRQRNHADQIKWVKSINEINFVEET